MVTERDVGEGRGGHVEAGSKTKITGRPHITKAPRKRGGKPEQMMDSRKKKGVATLICKATTHMESTATDLSCMASEVESWIHPE